MKMNFEKSKRKEKKSEQEIRADDKTLAYGIMAGVAVIGAAVSPVVGKEVKEIFTGEELLTPEGVSYGPKNQSATGAKSDETIRVLIGGEQVASLDGLNNQPKKDTD